MLTNTKVKVFVENAEPVPDIVLAEIASAVERVCETTPLTEHRFLPRADEPPPISAIVERMASVASREARAEPDMLVAYVVPTRVIFTCDGEDRAAEIVFFVSADNRGPVGFFVDITRAMRTLPNEVAASIAGSVDRVRHRHIRAGHEPGAFDRSHTLVKAVRLGFLKGYSAWQTQQ